jgi:hypothetical protein
MTSLRAERLRERWWVRGGVMAIALLTLATGLCLLDQHDGGSGADFTHPDLCLVMLLVPLALMALVGLLPAGAAVPVPLPAPYAITLLVPVPPPKRVSPR